MLNGFEPRKTPVQTRSAETVEAIWEATVQVLLAMGPDRLTTTRVAARAGVSVGTLYQYYPNKRALLYALLEQHLEHLADAVELVCGRSRGLPLEAMVAAVVEAFVDAKLERADISLALYSVASELDGPALVKRIGKRSRAALAAMLATTADRNFADAESTAWMWMAAMAGMTRAVLEAGARPELVLRLREHLRLMCLGYLEKAAV